MENLGNSEDSSTGTSEVEMDTPTCSYAVTGQDSMRMLYNAGKKSIPLCLNKNQETSAVFRY